jgi:hypothetical protein
VYQPIKKTKKSWFDAGVTCRYWFSVDFNSFENQDFGLEASVRVTLATIKEIRS